MLTDFLLERFSQHKSSDALIWRDQNFTYGWLGDRVRAWMAFLDAEKVAPGTVTAIEADFSPTSVALLLALIERACVLVPLTESIKEKKEEFKSIAECEISIKIGTDDQFSLTRLSRSANHELYRQLRQSGHPGLILFSSGSTGASKAALHDLCPLLDKFRVPRSTMRAITFLLFDHIGGFNTMLYQLSNAGCIVTVAERTPDAVLAAVAKYRVELLPTSPTFFNLILLSEAYKKYDLNSLKVMTYGTEPMQETTLKRFHDLFPNIKLQQTYGLSELGILRSKSKSSDSLWLKVGGEGFETRIVNGTLQIRAKSAMLGYLNHKSPFSDDGWFDTGDLVETDGDYIRFLGRKSEIINVGGEKVHPAEVESVLQEIDAVRQAAVYGEKNPITGNIVCADIVRGAGPEEDKPLILRIKKHCMSRMQPYKVPVKIRIVPDDLHSARFKLMRRRESGAY